MIQRLYIHNYKCFENFELRIAEIPSALLIGRNGTGKTSVGAALEMLQSIARGTNHARDLIGPNDIAWGRTDTPVRFELEVMLDRSLYQYKLAFELPAGSKELQVLEERLSVDHKDIYSRDRMHVTLPKTPKELADFLSLHLDWHLVALPIIYEKLGEPLEIFKSWLGRLLILAPLPSQIDGDSKKESLTPNRKVTNFGEWFSGLLAHSPAAYSLIDNHLKEVMPDLKDVKNPIVGKEARSIVVQFQREQATFSLPFRDLSDGEKVFFICAVALAANQEYGPLFCFWDEPDNYLSLSEVGHFVMALRRSFQSGGQILVTSHNPEAIRQFSNENTFVLQRRSRLEPTLIRPLSEIQINGDLVDALIRNDVEL